MAKSSLLKKKKKRRKAELQHSLAHPADTEHSVEKSRTENTGFYLERGLFPAQTSVILELTRRYSVFSFSLDEWLFTQET